MDIKQLKNIVLEAETRRETLVQEALPYSREELDPVLSKDSLDYHYGKLARAYVDRFNKQEGDDDFNYGGAVLHNLFFPQLMPAKTSNRPSGASAELINKKYKSFENFKEEFGKVAMGIQGSGWVYMDTVGNIKVIPNHEYRKGMKIALLIDWWEHVWALDYQHDKQKYLNNVWRIINWNTVNDRLLNK
jgi:Fe-Mn family superoxide dismutase